MEQPSIALTAVFLRTDSEYVGFVEEMPGVNASGRTLAETRAMLRDIAAVVFDERRRETASLLAGKEIIRESVVVPFPASPRG